MRVRAGQSKAGQDPQRSHRGNYKKRILHAWYTTYLSGMLVTVSANIVCACSNRTTVTLHSQKDSRLSENRTLTDVLEQQGATSPSASISNKMIVVKRPPVHARRVFRARTNGGTIEIPSQPPALKRKGGHDISRRQS